MYYYITGVPFILCHCYSQVRACVLVISSPWRAPDVGNLQNGAEKSVSKKFHCHMPTSRASRDLGAQFEFVGCWRRAQRLQPPGHGGGIIHAL